MVRANPYLNPNLDGVAVLVADVARDHHDLHRGDIGEIWGRCRGDIGEI